MLPSSIIRVAGLAAVALPGLALAGDLRRNKRDEDYFTWGRATLSGLAIVGMYLAYAPNPASRALFQALPLFLKRKALLEMVEKKVSRLSLAIEAQAVQIMAKAQNVANDRLATGALPRTRRVTSPLEAAQRKVNTMRKNGAVTLGRIRDRARDRAKKLVRVTPDAAYARDLKEFSRWDRFRYGQVPLGLAKIGGVWESKITSNVTTGGALLTMGVMWSIELMTQLKNQPGNWDPAGFAGFTLIGFGANVGALAVDGTKFYGLISHGKLEPRKFPWHYGWKLKPLFTSDVANGVRRQILKETLHFGWQCFAMGAVISTAVFLCMIPYELTRAGRDNFEGRSGVDDFFVGGGRGFKRIWLGKESKEPEGRYDYIWESFWNNLKYGWMRRLIAMVLVKPGSGWFALLCDGLFLPQHYYGVLQHQDEKLTISASPS